MIPAQSTARSRKYLKDILYIYLYIYNFEIRKIRLIQALPCAKQKTKTISPVTQKGPDYITTVSLLNFIFFLYFFFNRRSLGS